jgi:hypothetical protein
MADILLDAEVRMGRCLNIDPVKLEVLEEELQNYFPPT